jgi:hypothetical protein
MCSNLQGDSFIHWSTSFCHKMKTVYRRHYIYFKWLHIYGPECGICSICSSPLEKPCQGWMIKFHSTTCRDFVETGNTCFIAIVKSSVVWGMYCIDLGVTASNCPQSVQTSTGSVVHCHCYLGSFRASTVAKARMLLIKYPCSIQSFVHDQTIVIISLNKSVNRCWFPTSSLRILCTLLGFCFCFSLWKSVFQHCMLSLIKIYFVICFALFWPLSVM